MGEGILLVFLDLLSNSFIIVDLHNLNATKYQDKEKYDEHQGTVQLSSGSVKSDQKFSPLAVDDYFMSIAILSKKLKPETVCCPFNK